MQRSSTFPTFFTATQGIKHGWYTQPATPADVAPTLAAIYGITLPQAEGHALR